jgi:hypothetical protein
MKILLAMLNTGLALFVGYWTGLGLLFSIATLSGSRHLLSWILLVLLVLLLAASVFAGWILALKRYDSIRYKIIAFLPIPYYLFFGYMLISNELSYRYSNDRGYCNEQFVEEYGRRMLLCHQVKNGIETGSIFYKELSQ